MSEIWQDLRIGARGMLSRPGFTLVAILTLGIGIGANAAIYSLVEAVLLRPLPFPEPERLVAIWETAERDELELRGLSYPVLEDLSRAGEVFDDVAGIYRTQVNLTGDAEPERVVAELVSPAYFRLLDATSLRGRLLLGEDDLASTNVPAVVLSESLWRRRFGAEPSIVGEDVFVNEIAATVVGVTSSAGLSGDAELFLPLRGGAAVEARLTDRRYESRGNRWLDAIGRTRPEVSPEVLSAWMERETERLRVEHGRVMERRGVLALPLDEQLFGDVQRTALLLMAAVGMVLLIACANLANLLLARSVSRKREMALRRAIGATSFQLARQLLTESLLLSFLGGTAGVLLALWAKDGLRNVALFEQLPAYVALRLDGGTLAFAAVLSVLTALLFGGGPALATVRTELARTLRGERPPSARAILPGRELLVAGQVGLALALTVVSGLLLQSLAHELEIDPGFRSENLYTLRVQLPERYEREAAVRFAQEIEERLGAVAGIEAVALGSDLPLVDGYSAFNVRTEDGVREDPEDSFRVYHHEVTPSFFRTLGIDLRAGRVFSEVDRSDAPLVMVVSEKLAETAWPGEPVEAAVGKRVVIGSPENPFRTVVGVVADVRYRDLVVDPVVNPDDPDVYLPLAQAPSRELGVVVGASGPTSGLLEPVRRELQALDPAIPIFQVRGMEEIVASELALSRFAGVLLTAFGAVALALAGLGLYGLLAHLVAERSRDLGIRMALGASAGDVVGLVLRRGLGLVVAGCAAGLAASLAFGRFLESFLYEVSPMDAGTLALASLLLVVVALVASYLPARRASRVSPVTLLGSRL